MKVALTLLFALLGAWAQTTMPSQPGSELQVPKDPTRDPWQKPDQVISTLNFQVGETVAVIEDGYPYFAPRIAPLVKQVFAVNEDARAFQGRGNLPSSIRRVIGSPTTPNITSLTLDRIIMVDMIRWLPQRALYWAAILLALKPGGSLVIIDRQLPPVYPAAVRITDTILKRELPILGLRFVQQYTFLPYQYFLVFQR